MNCDDVLNALKIDRGAWDAYLTGETALLEARAAIDHLFSTMYPIVVSRELNQRGVRLDELCRGSWVLVRSGKPGSGFSLAVILNEVTQNRTYKVWLPENDDASDDTVENVDAINIGKHLKDEYPAPIALNGKSVLPKAKMKYIQLEAILRNSKL